MISRSLLGASALALIAVAGSDSALNVAQSFTIPTLCADAEQCAALCSRLIEVGRSERDFIERAPLTRLGALPVAGVQQREPVGLIRNRSGDAGIHSTAQQNDRFPRICHVRR